MWHFLAFIRGRGRGGWENKGEGLGGGRGEGGSPGSSLSPFIHWSVVAANKIKSKKM